MEAIHGAVAAFAVVVAVAAQTPGRKARQRLGLSFMPVFIGEVDNAES